MCPGGTAVVGDLHRHRIGVRVAARGVVEPAPVAHERLSAGVENGRREDGRPIVHVAVAVVGRAVVGQPALAGPISVGPGVSAIADCVGDRHAALPLAVGHRAGDGVAGIGLGVVGELHDERRAADRVERRDGRVRRLSDRATGGRAHGEVVVDGFAARRWREDGLIAVRRQLVHRDRLEAAAGVDEKLTRIRLRRRGVRGDVDHHGRAAAGRHELRQAAGEAEVEGDLEHAVVREAVADLVEVRRAVGQVGIIVVQRQVVDGDFRRDALAGVQWNR